MSATEIDFQNLAAVKDAYGELQLALDLGDAKLERLVDTAFESKERAWRAMVKLTRGYGAEATIKLLEDRGVMSRAWYFGFLRGHMFAPTARKAAHHALAEIPGVLRDREALMLKRDELLRARRLLTERVDRNRLDSGRPSDESSRKQARSRY